MNTGLPPSIPMLGLFALLLVGCDQPGRQLDRATPVETSAPQETSSETPGAPQKAAPPSAEEREKRQRAAQRARYALKTAVLRGRAMLPSLISAGVGLRPGYNGGFFTHGGPLLQLTEADFSARVLDGKAHELRVLKVELLHGDPKKPKAQSSQAIKLLWSHSKPRAAQRAEIDRSANPAHALAPGGLYDIEIGFEKTDLGARHKLYFAVTLMIDGQPPQRLLLPLRIKRLEPHRRR